MDNKPNLKELLNLTIVEADSKLQNYGMYCREIKRDYKDIIITMDLRDDRVNVCTCNDIIYKVCGIY
jgi:hypothetical protein